MKLREKLQLALLSLWVTGKKGQGTLDTVIAVVVAAVALVVGIIIIAELFDATDWATKYDVNNSARDAFNTTEQMTWTAFGILPIVLLVMAAVAVIAAVLVLRGRRD